MQPRHNFEYILTVFVLQLVTVYDNKQLSLKDIYFFSGDVSFFKGGSYIRSVLLQVTVAVSRRLVLSY